MANSTNTNIIEEDFFRATIDNTLPDGTDDVSEGIYHDGTIHIGNANNNNTSRFSHLGIVSYIGNGTFGTQTIQTNIPASSILMPTIFIKGYAYESANTIDLQLGVYTYSVPLNSVTNPVWSSKGSTKPTQIRMAYVGGFLAIELTWASLNDYFQRWEVSAYCDGNSTNQNDSMFENWSVSTTPLPNTAVTITAVPDKTPTGGITVIDNTNGTVTTNAGGANVQDAIRPINELSAITLGQLSPDDRIPIFDATTNTHKSVSITDILTDNFDNDLGIGVDGKIETGFALHRDTNTTGAFYRQWQNNSNGALSLNSSGLLYGYKNNLISGNSWDTSLITGTASLVIGSGNTNSGNYGGTIGRLLVNNSGHSFATGLLNELNGGNYSLITGYNNKTSNMSNSVVFGYGNGTTASPITANYSLFSGYGHIGSGSAYSGVFGRLVTATGNYHLVSGNQQNVSGNYHLVTGATNTVSGFTNSVTGYNNTIDSSYNTSSGYTNTITAANYSTAFGSSNRILSGNYNSAIGYNNEVTTGTGVNLIGYLNKNTTGNYNTISGYNNNNAIGNNNFITGVNNVVNSNISIVGGQGNTFLDNSSTYSLVVGYNQQVGGAYHKTCLGYLNTINTNTHVVFNIGQSNIVGNSTGVLTNSGAGALGSNNTVVGQTAIAIGNSNNIQGTNRIAIGNGLSGVYNNGVQIAGISQSLGFFGSQGATRISLPAAATNAANNLTLTNAMRQLLINYGLAI